MTPERILRAIQIAVEPVYLHADVSNFSGSIRTAIDQWGICDNYYFHGDTGTGKTHAMYVLLKIAIANGYRGELSDFGQLCRNIRSAFDRKIPEQELRDKFLKMDVLFLDDMGLKDSASDYEYDVFYDILDSRISNQLATVISSNKQPEQVAAGFDKRILSRLHLFKKFEFVGNDKRKQMPKP